MGERAEGGIGRCAATGKRGEEKRRRERGAAAMGGGGHGGGTTYKGYTIPHNKRWHTVAGKGLCAVMWFWVFYRAKQDGAVLLGMRHPWDGHDDHSHGHGHEHEGSSSTSSSR